jgi:parallel beta-helix repeat protein
MQTKKVIMFCAAVIILALIKYSTIHARCSLVTNSPYASSPAYPSDALDHIGENPTEVPAGNVSGTWTLVNSPYHINGEIIVPNDSTLTIEPGVNVVFTGHYKLNVQGRLLAIGTIQDTITFTAQDTSVGWHGIRFRDTSNTNDSSKIIYCSLKYGKANTGDDYDRCGGALFVKGFNKLYLSNCLFSCNMNSGNLAVHGGGAIGILSCSPIIENNIITCNRAVGNHGGGICIAWSSNPVIRNNLICKNHAAGGGGLLLYQSNPVFTNNTIVYNYADLPGSQVCHGGAACIIDCSPQFFNTIIFGNTAIVGNQVNLQGSSQPDFHFCDIESGKKSFARNFVNEGSYSGVYEFNIESDPLFLDTSSDDYRLTENSPCISNGTDSIEVNGTWHYASIFDMNGNPRPNPANTTPDIGAIENSTGYYNPPAGIFEVPKSDANAVKLFQNYPNPFTTFTEIPFSLPINSLVKLQVLDCHGRAVEMLFNKDLQPGEYRLSFDATGFPGGLYFIQLRTGNGIQTVKCVIIR